MWRFSGARRSGRDRAAAIALCALAFAVAPSAAMAYIGPGAGFALVSSFLSFVLAFLAAFAALLTFPLRMLWRRLKRKRPPREPRADKVIVLGLDGLDPAICERLMAAGELPNLSRIAAEGTFRRLGTSTPAMSPVAWSTFSTGVDASRHGIFDFLARDPLTYLPVLSSSRVTASKRVLKLGRLRLPLGKGRARFLRKSASFWKVLGEYGIFSTVLRVPITFPPEPLNGVMLSGMCAPDLRGTMGSFTYFRRGGAGEKIGGMVIALEERDGVLSARLPGPESPVADETLQLPLEIRPDVKRRGAEIRISGARFFLLERTYSPWIRLSFKAAPGLKLHGIARFYITRLDPDFALYVSPIHIDPDKPAMPVSYPAFYSSYLAKRLGGPFGTLGLAEDTWALNEGVLDEDAFIEQAYLFHREREMIWFHSLRAQKKGLIACVFDLSDRMQHMFFRYLEDGGATGPAGAERRGTLDDMYRAMDELVGKTAAFAGARTAFFVISDHGFKAFRRGVDLNVWLKRNGYLALRPDARGDEFLRDVDWSKTRAYALGLGGMYLNLKGRERHGTVEPAEAAALKTEIASKLLELTDSDGARAVSRVFDTARDFTGPYRAEGPDLIVGLAEGYRISWDCARGLVQNEVVENNEKNWSGDHCIDPALVPGVLFSNLRIAARDPNIADIAPTVLRLFGIDPPAYMTGRDLS